MDNTTSTRGDTLSQTCNDNDNDNDDDDNKHNINTDNDNNRIYVRRHREHHTFLDASVLSTDNGAVTSLRHPAAYMSRWTQHAIKTHFLPKGYPSSVSEEYIHYAKWQALQHVVGAMAGVLSTQSLLYAVGVGSGSIPLAAAVNWVLKDGLGQLGGIVFASRVNVEFDADPKRWRFFGGMVLDIATGLEVMSPLFPSYFLPVASMANIGKNIAVLAGSATRATIHRSMCRRNNLGDVTGKAGSQAIATSLMGTGLGVLASLMIGSSFSAVFPSFLLLSAMHLYCLYRSLDSVSIHTLNRQRIDIIVDSYLHNNHIMSPKQVSRKERFAYLFPPKHLSHKVRVNPRLDSAVRNMDHLTAMRTHFNNKHYIITLHNNFVNLLVLQGASFHDVLEGFLLAVIVQREWLRSSSINTEDYSLHDEKAILESSQTTAERMYSGFVQELKEAGWDVRDYYIEPHGGRILFKHNKC